MDELPAVGELVDAKWPEDDRFYSAIVTALPADASGLVTVRFDDGLTLELPLSDIRRLVYTDNSTLSTARRVGAAWTPEELVEHGQKLLDTLGALKHGR